MTENIRVLIADDHTVVREGLSTILSLQSDIRVVGEAANGEEAITLAKTLQPDVLLIDLVMPHTDGLEAIRAIKQAHPDIRILVLTSFADDERVFPAIKAGALGYLLKDVSREQLVKAVRQVAAGQASLHPAIALKLMGELGHSSDLPATEEPLTAREMQTLRLIARGMTNQEIAAQLGLQERTVAKYVSNILDKLHLANRTQAALYALREGWADLS